MQTGLQVMLSCFCRFTFTKADGSAHLIDNDVLILPTPTKFIFSGSEKLILLRETSGGNQKIKKHNKTPQNSIKNNNRNHFRHGHYQNDIINDNGLSGIRAAVWTMDSLRISNRYVSQNNMARLNIILSVSTFLFFLALAEDCQSRRPALSKIGH